MPGHHIHFELHEWTDVYLFFQKFSKSDSLIPARNDGNASNQVKSLPLQINNKLVVKIEQLGISHWGRYSCFQVVTFILNCMNGQMFICLSKSSVNQIVLFQHETVVTPRIKLKGFYYKVIIN